MEVVLRNRQLPRGNLVVSVGGEALVSFESIISLEALISLVTSSIVTASSGIVTKVASDGLLISAVVPLNVLGVSWLLVLEKIRNWLLALEQDLDEILSEILIAIVVERRRLALVSNTSGTANSMDVLGDAVVLRGRKFEINDMLDVGNLKASVRLVKQCFT